MFTRLGQPMNRYTLRFFLAICANADFPFILQYSHSKTSRTIRFLCKDLHETLKYVGKFSESKNDEIKKKTHTHASLSLSLSTCRSADALPKGCACTSLSLFLCLHLQKRFGSRSDPNGTQERMFRQ